MKILIEYTPLFMVNWELNTTSSSKAPSQHIRGPATNPSALSGIWKGMASPLPSSLHRLSLLSKPSPPQNHRLLVTPTRPELSRFECRAGQTGFFTRLGRLIKEKAKSDVEKLFSGFSKTRDNLAVIDELLLYWNLADTDRVLDELEEVFLLSLFVSREKRNVFVIISVVFGFRLCWYRILVQKSQLRLWKVWGRT